MAHAVCLSIWGTGPKAFFTSNIIEWMIAIVVLLVIERTARRSSGYVKGVWRLLELAYVLYAFAQIFWVCSLLYPHAPFYRDGMHLLFNIWFMPLGIAILLEPDSDGRWFHSILVVDVLQALIFGVVASRFFQSIGAGWFSLPQPDRLSTLPYFVYYIILIGAFFLRSRTSRARSRRTLFRQLGILLSLSCLVDLVDWTGLGTQLPAIFQMRYTLVLCVPLIFVVHWNAHGQRDENWELGQGRYSRITLLLPLLYPSLILYMAVTLIRSSVPYAWTMVALSFLTSSARQLLTQDRLLKARKTLERQATRDGLTGLWNRAAILDILKFELQRAERTHLSVGVIMLDVDHFKVINDSYGHTAGDHALRKLAERMGSVLRPYDSLGRYGGEEFLIIAPVCGMSASTALAERIRETIAAVDIELPSCRITTTVSAGVATASYALDFDTVLRLADEACYRAKSSGRNRVESACADAGTGTLGDVLVSHAGSLQPMNH